MGERSHEKFIHNLLEKLNITVEIHANQITGHWHAIRITLFSASNIMYGEWSRSIFLEIKTSSKSVIGAQIAWYTMLSVLHNLHTKTASHNN